MLYSAVVRRPSALWVQGHDSSGKIGRKIAEANPRASSLLLRQLFLDARTGSLEPGRDAGIAIRTQNPCTIAGEALKNLTCEMTLLAGKVVLTAKPE